MTLSSRSAILATALTLLLLMVAGCASSRVQRSQSFTINQNQQMVPIVPFTSTLVPESFSEAVFNDYVDSLNDARQETGFSWFGIVKDDMGEVEKIIANTHVYITGEIWSYIENSGCCSTELRVKSRLRIERVVTHELLWEAEIPLDSFFEHDRSTFPVERQKLAKRLSEAMTRETVKALTGAKRISVD